MGKDFGCLGGGWSWNNITCTHSFTSAFYSLQFKGGVKSVFSHLALVGAAAALIAVAAGQWGAVDAGVKVYLGLEAFAYAARGLKLFASTTLGKLIKTRLLDNKAYLQRIGEWFSEGGLPKDISGTFLAKLWVFQCCSLHINGLHFLL